MWVRDVFHKFLCPRNEVFAAVRIFECTAVARSVPRSHHVPLSREKRNKDEEIISFLLCPYRRIPLFLLNFPHLPSQPSPQQPIDSFWVFLLSTSLEIYISSVYFSSFPLFFFWEGGGVPPSTSSDMVPCVDLRRLDAIKQASAASFRLRALLLVFDES